MAAPMPRTVQAMRHLARRTGQFEEPFQDLDPRAQDAMSMLLEALDLDNVHQLSLFLDVGTTTTHSWLTRGIPVTYCHVFERYTNGRVTAHDLRPDWFAG